MAVATKYNTDDKGLKEQENVTTAVDGRVNIKNTYEHKNQQN